MVERKRKSDQEVDHLFRTESFGIVDNVGEVQPEFSGEDDEDWEDKVDEDEEDGRGKYNRLKLKYFAREVDRYQWSDRGAAKLGNGLLEEAEITKTS